MYNKITGDVDYVIKAHQNYLKKFGEFISTASEDLKDIEALEITNLLSDALILKVIGFDIKITFSMVFNKGYPIGQISAILINNNDKASESENHIISGWFDEHGNVNYPLIEQASTYNMLQNNYLKKFVYQTIYALFSSSNMNPNVNNG